MKRFWFNLGQFYGTVAVPVIYLLGLKAIISTNSLVVNVNTQLVGLFIAFTGIGLWVWSYVSLGKAFGVLPRKQQVVVKGAYRYLEHPMYLGISMVYLGLAAANRSADGMIFVLTILIPLLVGRAWWEKKMLFS